MVGGRLRCLGSIQHLKQRFGHGYIVDMKLDDPTAEFVAGIEAAAVEALVRLGVPGGGSQLPRLAVLRLAEALGNAPRGEQVMDTGTGWAIAAEFARSTLPAPSAPPSARVIPTRNFAQWWATEDTAVKLRDFVFSTFPGAQLVERHGSHMRFHLPPQGDRALAGLFTAIEAARAPLGISSYALGQTSLEDIFNVFASQQEEEKGQIRGMQARTATAAPAAAGATTDNAAPHAAVQLV